MPAPLGNTSARKHGLRAQRVGDKGIENNSQRLCQELRAELLAIHGSTSLYHEAVLQTVGRHEQRLRLAAKWLRTEEGLKLADRLALLAVMGQASDARDRSIEKLGISQPAHDNSLGSLAAAFYSQPATAEGLAPQTALASPQTSAGSNPPLETDEGVNACEKFKQERTAGVAAANDQTAYTAEDRSH
jgi:hypothetical protein